MARRIAALYDIHGNLPALKAALDEASTLDCDGIVFGGDVALGYMPAETLSLLMELRPRARFVMGNADREVIRIWDGGEAHMRALGDLGTWVAARLNREHRDFMASFEAVVDADVDGVGHVLFCHGTPRSDEEIVTSDTPTEVLAQALGLVSADVVVAGHTHMQLDRHAAGRRFVNAGSVGMPYGGTGAFWLLVGPGVDLRHTHYALEAAAAGVRATGAPGSEEFAAQNVLTTPSAAEAIEHFERQAGRRPVPTT